MPDRRVEYRIYRGLGVTIIFGFAALIIIVVSAFQLFARRPLPQISGRMEAAGLEQPVTVIRDKNGVPHLFAGTGHDGVWRRPLSEMITPVFPAESRIPRMFALDQNYPNPFNPSTIIHYGLPNHSHVTLTVFNTLGQQVAQLVDGEIDAGYHEVKFDGSGLSSGVYFYRLRTGDFVETKTLLLAR